MDKYLDDISSIVTRFSEDWNLTKMPPEGHQDVGPFFYSLFLKAKRYREWLSMPERWLEGYRAFRGDVWHDSRRYRKRHRAYINLLAANIIRTVANITAQQPVSEVVSMDGLQDDADLILTQAIKAWWNEQEQQRDLSDSTYNMETYGTTIEKGVFEVKTKTPKTVVVDPFAFFPAPGVWANLNDAPYLCHAYPMDIEMVEAIYGVKGVQPHDTYSLFGGEREEARPIPSGANQNAVNYPGNFASQTTDHPGGLADDGRQRKALVVEIWVRDPAQETVEVEGEGGETLTITRDKYPGKIRVVTLTNNGQLVLDDKPNPNINDALPRELTQNTYLYHHFPFAKACSYVDTTCTWGFSMFEQTADILKILNELLARLASYAFLCLLPPLIIPKDTGITRRQINNKPGLVLFPTTSGAANAIRYLQVPNPPAFLFELIRYYIEFFDRVCQIQDVDRGQAPNKVVAASAIVALQERGQVMMRQKIRSIDYLVRERGRWAVSFFQNFGIEPQVIEVNEEPVEFVGTKYITRRFKFIVESGSTVAKTSLQRQEQAVQLYQLGAIDQRALLEILNFPGWKAIIERMGEDQLQAALQVLVQAGLPEDVAQELYAVLMQPQGGPGDAIPPGNSGNVPAGEPLVVSGSENVPPPKAYQGQQVEGM